MPDAVANETRLTACPAPSGPPAAPIDNSAPVPLAWRDAALLFGATMVSHLLTGMDLGTRNHVIQLPMLFRRIAPELYSSDYYVRGLDQWYYSTFWSALAFAGRFVSVDALLVASHIVSRFLLLAAVFYLTRRMFPRGAARWVAVAFASFQLDGVLALEVIVHGVPTHTTFAFPLLIWALAFVLERRVVLAAALLGLAGTINLMTCLSTVLVAAAALFALRPLPEWRRIVLAGVVLGGFLLRPLLWARTLPGPDIPIEEYYTWMLGAFARHLDPPRWPAVYFIRLAGLCGVLAIGWRCKPPTRFDRPLVAAFAAIVGTWALACVFSLHPIFHKAVRLQLGRTCALAVMLSIPLAANAAVAMWQSRRARDAAGLLLLLVAWGTAHGKTSAALLACIAIAADAFSGRGWLAAIAAALERHSTPSAVTKDSRAWRQALAGMLRGRLVGRMAVLVAAIIIVHAAIKPSLGGRRSGWIIRGADPRWIDVQEWARANTPLNAMFLPQYGEIGFRVHSRRAVWISVYDADVMLWQPGLTSEFKRRWGLMCDHGADLDPARPVDWASVHALAQHESIDYAVARVEALAGQSAIYQNDRWAIVKLR